MTYAIVRGLARLLLAVFYRRVEVHGLEHVPARGPLVVAANHHNALVDPMLLLATIPRRLAPLAKAPLFRHPLIAPFLRLAGALPVQRPQDAPGGGASNVAMFAKATDELRRGGAILIFPEGVSQAVPTLLPLRTGIARLALEAAEAAPDAKPTVLPVGLVFHRPADFRAGHATVVIGAPVELDDLVARHRVEPIAAVRELTARVASALRALIIEAGDAQTLRLLELAHEVWRDGGTRVPVAERLAWMREAARRLTAVPPALRDRVDRLGRELERYDKDARRAADGEGTRRHHPARAATLLLGGLPLALIGIAIHGPAYRATEGVVRALRPEPDSSATYQLAAGLVLFPLSWSVEGALLVWLAGPWTLLPFVALLAPSGFHALSWRERLRRFPREVGAWAAGLAGGRPRGDLTARRRWLRRELEELAALTASASP
jgi:1-acyl-sn-glycerol-3-phosphate acyltransferase